MVVAALYLAGTCFPNLDGAIFGASNHPLSLAVEGDARDIARVALEGQQRVGVGRFDVKELDGVVAGGGEEALVWRDTEAVDLRVRVLDCSGTDTGQGFPEPVTRAVWLGCASGSREERQKTVVIPDCVVISSW